MNKQHQKPPHGGAVTAFLPRNTTSAHVLLVVATTTKASIWEVVKLGKNR